MWRALIILVALLCATTSFATRAQQRWLSDFNHLLSIMQTHYANMLYTYKIQQVNLPSLKQQTIEKIKKSRTEKQFRKTIYWFIAHFRDDHFTPYDPIDYRVPILFKRHDNNIIQDSHQLPGCQLVKGDKITAINGHSIQAVLNEYQGYVRFRDLRSRQDQAMIYMVGSSIALDYPLHVTGIHKGKQVTCIEDKLPHKPRKLPPVCQKPDPYLGHQLLALPHPNIVVLKNGSGFIKTGLITLKNKKQIGVMEINSFNPVRMANGFCPYYWKRYTKTHKTCDAACQQNFQRYYLYQKMIDAYSEAIALLKQQPISALLIDVLQNGGGAGDPADVLTRLLSPAGINSPLLSTIKTKNSQHNFDQLQSGLTALKKHSLNKAEQRWQAVGQQRLNQLSASLKQHCDLSRLWKDKAFKAKCSNLTHSQFWPPGLYGYLNPQQSDQKQAFATVYELFHFSYQPNLYSGPIFVLMNRRSASSAEYLINMLKDNRATTLIGEKTRGAGCGYHNLPGPMTLPNTKMQISLPNCVRYRKSGENAVAGTPPDIYVLVPDNTQEFYRLQTKVIHLLNKETTQP